MKFLTIAAVCCFAVAAILSTTVSTKAQSKSKTQSKSNTQSTSEKKIDNPQYIISVTQGGKPLGDIVVELYPDVAPKHVHNFDSLVSVGFYNGTAFHRVIPGFMIQGGDPNSKTKPREAWGSGDNTQTRVPAEFNKTPHTRGVLSAARTADPNSATSQFFICVADASWLDGQYTAYGKAISGLEVVDKVVNAKRDERDNPVEKIEMTIVKKGSIAKKDAAAKKDATPKKSSTPKKK